jgi:hypothetical protein
MTATQLVLETWLLTFHPATAPPFVGGEYQTQERCRRGAREQLPYWTLMHGEGINWSCKHQRR